MFIVLRPDLYTFGVQSIYRKFGKPLGNFYCNYKKKSTINKIIVKVLGKCLCQTQKQTIFGHS